jgi:hypothetical protein
MVEVILRKTKVFTEQVLSVGFEVLTAVSMKTAAFWVVAPCSLVGVIQRFSDAWCVIALMMEAARTPLKLSLTSTRLHGATTQKAAI